MKISIKEGKLLIDGEGTTIIYPKKGETGVKVECGAEELFIDITGMVIIFPTEDEPAHNS